MGMLCEEGEEARSEENRMAVDEMKEMQCIEISRDRAQICA